MYIRNLVENTEGNALCGCEHGLSFYIETQRHKLLMDTGASDLFMRNAQALGIDLTAVDTVILSHGHYDHGGGIMPFSEINSGARIYLQTSAFGDYCSLHREGERYIGLSPQIRDLKQIVPVGRQVSQDMAAGSSSEDPGVLEIDDELTLFWNIGNTHPVPDGNKSLKIRTPGSLVQDDFRHEQCLVIRQDGRTVLLSGCAHHGILNILDRFRALFGCSPDAVISGFHMMRRHGYSKSDIRTIEETAAALKDYPAQFFTCHCTGTEPYEMMRRIMGGQLRYVHCGEEVSFC